MFKKPRQRSFCTLATPGVYRHRDNNKASISTVVMMAELMSKQIPQSMLECTGELIGEGSFGICQKGVMQSINFCVKKLKNTHETQYHILHEAYILNKLKHPCLCWLAGVQMEVAPYQIVTPLYQVNGMSVQYYDLLFNKARHDICSNIVPLYCINFWLELLVAIAEGLQYLHMMNIVYRDLKTDNIVMYQRKCKIKPVIIDFGKCQFQDDCSLYILDDKQKAKYLNEHKHISPDIVDGSVVPSPASDVYSFGRILKYTIQFGDVPVKEWPSIIKSLCKASLKYASHERPGLKFIIETLESQFH